MYENYNKMRRKEDRDRERERNTEQSNTHPIRILILSLSTAEARKEEGGSKEKWGERKGGVYGRANVEVEGCSRRAA